MHTKKPIPEESIDRRPIIIATAIMSVFAILYVLFPTLLINVDDAASYVALAQGHIDKVAAPFSGRMLFALLARELGWLFGLDVAHGFGILSILSVFTFFYFVARILSDYTETRSLRSYILVSAIPFTWFTFGHAAMPEPIGFALTAAALRQFQRKRISIGCILIACAMATRETYILLMLVVCVWLIFRRDWWRLALSLVLGAAAWMLVQFFTKLGQPNVNNMSPLLYMLAKIPENLAAEVFGMEIWTNGYTWCDTPIYTMDVPTFLLKFSGKITKFGTCGVHPLIPLGNIYLILAEFATLPVMLWVALRNRRSDIPGWLAVCMIYGALMFVLGTCTGKSVWRLLAYAWPLFLLGAPILWFRYRVGVIDLKILCLNAILLGFSLIFMFTQKTESVPSSYWLTILLIILTIIIYIVAYPLYKAGDLRAADAST